MTRAIIVATGPSLTNSDIDLIKSSGCVVYAVNNAYLYFPLASVVYGCDLEWWDLHYRDVARMAPGADRWTTNNEAAQKYGLNHVGGEHWEQRRMPFNTSGHGIVYGGNSGFQALNLAYINGVRDACLIGFDMGHEKNEPKHCHGEHPSGINRPSPFNDWIENFKRAAPVIEAAGMRVRNATRKTRLTCFAKIDLNDWLND